MTSKAKPKAFNGYAVLADAHRHTAIKVGETPKSISIIPLGPHGLKVIKLSPDRFAAEWAVIAYPLKKAAQMFLNSEVGKSSNTSSEARGILETVLSDEVSDPSVKPLPSYMENSIMATAKKPAAKKAVSKKPAAKKAAAKKPDVAAKVAATKPLAALDGNFKLGDDSGVKRGFLLDFVTEAKKMKPVTRAALVAKFKTKEDEDRLMRYFGYAVKNGIFVAA